MPIGSFRKAAKSQRTESQESKRTGSIGEKVPVTEQAWSDLDILPQSAERGQAEKVLHQIDQILRSRQARKLPAMELRSLDDPLSLQWLSGKCRVGFNFEKDPHQSGWFLVTGSRSATNSYGHLQDADLEYLLDTFIQRQKQ